MGSRNLHTSFEEKQCPLQSALQCRFGKGTAPQERREGSVRMSFEPLARSALGGVLQIAKLCQLAEESKTELHPGRRLRLQPGGAGDGDSATAKIELGLPDIGAAQAAGRFAVPLQVSPDYARVDTRRAVERDNRVWLSLKKLNHFIEIGWCEPQQTELMIQRGKSEGFVPRGAVDANRDWIFGGHGRTRCRRAISV